MVNIRVLSWNIESLGDAKAAPVAGPLGAALPSEIINFINLVVRSANADIVGIMEVKSGYGARILGWLLPRLNNGAAGADLWKGRVSARQDGGTQEEALYLWRERTNTLALDLAGMPAPISSIGIVDANLLQITFRDLGIATNDVVTPVGFAVTQEAFLDALAHAPAGYIRHGSFKRRNTVAHTTTWRMDADQWHGLATAASPAVNFGATPLPPLPGPPPTPAQLRQLAAQLIGADILRFIGYDDRSPFLGNFLVGNPPKKLMVGMLHAPGPGDPRRMTAINVIGLSTAAAAAANLIVMGDFNIAEDDDDLEGTVYGRFPGGAGFTFGEVTPRQYQRVFDPITSAPLNAASQALLPDPRTTVIKRYVRDATPMNDVLANTYDKFFFRPNTANTQKIAASAPSTWNLLDRMVAGQPGFWPVVAQSALTFFRALRGDDYLAEVDDSLDREETKLQKAFNRASEAVKDIQNQINLTKPAPGSQLYTRLANANDEEHKANLKLAAVQAQREAVAELSNLIASAATAPSGVGTALAIYRLAISDHFPISLDLQT